jgi:hypothetical protein
VRLLADADAVRAAADEFRYTTQRVVGGVLPPARPDAHDRVALTPAGRAAAARELDELGRELAALEAKLAAGPGSGFDPPRAGLEVGDLGHLSLSPAVGLCVRCLSRLPLASACAASLACRWPLRALSLSPAVGLCVRCLSRLPLASACAVSLACH